MKVRLQMIIESEAGHVEVIKELVMLERHKKLTPNRLGLSLAESKQSQLGRVGWLLRARLRNKSRGRRDGSRCSWERACHRRGQRNAWPLSRSTIRNRNDGSSKC